MCETSTLFFVATFGTVAPHTKKLATPLMSPYRKKNREPPPPPPIQNCFQRACVTTYEHKGIISCTDKPRDLSTKYWENRISDPKTPKISVRSQSVYTVCIKKNGTVRKYFLKNMKLVHKYKYLISYQSGINALSVAILIILIAFVNQELCHVLCDETKSRLCHFWYLS